MSSPIHITQHKTGLKMSGFISINTAQSLNPFCRAQCKKDNSICRHCYSRQIEITYKNLRAHLKENYTRLSVLLSDREISQIARDIQEENKHFIRFNSFGELTGRSNLENYYRICEALPDQKFGLWTKRSPLVQQMGRAPDNLSMIYSNPVIDSPVDKSPRGFNGVFNVITYEYARDNQITPNCTGRCISCLKCYTGAPVVIVELLKKDQTRISKGQIPAIHEVI
jgi:hypothetical protein